MAKGRFISKEICVDKKVNDLSDPWSMLGFTWLVTHADREGRTYGDPSVVRSMVFPRQSSITVEDVEKYIRDWHTKGLVILYEYDGDLYIEFPKFSTHQIGLRKDREPSSTIPQRDAEVIQQTNEVVPDNIRQTSGKHPAEVNVIEVNGIEVEGKKAKIIKAATATTDKALTINSFTEKIFVKLTGMIAIPASHKGDAVNAVEALRGKYDTVEKMVTYLKPYWEEWDRRPYNKTNLAWLTDWAVSGEIPVAKSASTDKKKEFEAEMKRRGLQPMEEVR